jgi:hypothetical protein
MFEIVNVRDNLVRICCGLSVFDITFTFDSDLKKIRSPQSTRVDNFKTPVCLVLETYEHSITGENATHEV